MDKHANEKIMKEIRNFVSKANIKFKLYEVILFGSRARGDFMIHSDVDIILVSKSFEKLKFSDRINEIIGYWQGDVDLEVICYTPREFEIKKKQIGIIRKAVSEGIKIK